MHNKSVEIDLEILDEIRELAERAMTRPFQKSDPEAEIQVEETSIETPEGEVSDDALSEDDLSALLDDYETRKGR